MARSRRARRRSQSSRRARGGPRQWLARGLVVVIVLSLLGVLGGYVWFQNFLRSERFRLMVNERVSEKLEANAAFERFVWDGMELRAPKFHAEGEKMIRRVALEGLETEVKFRPLLSKKVETREIHARKLEVEIDVTADGPSANESEPGAFVFAAARVDELNGVADFGTTALRWEGVQGTISPGQFPGSYDATLSRGKLHTPLVLFPEISLEDAELRLVERDLYLKESAWKVFQSGRLLTNGEIDFGSTRYIFNGELTDVQCEEVLTDDWAKRLRGEIGSTFVVEGAGKNAPLVTGDLELVRGHLTALPVLDKIAAYTSTERFRRLNLREARLAYRQKGDLLELTDIELASEGLLRLEGDLTIDGSRLDGEFMLGLTPQTLARIPAAARRVFAPGKMGMHWTPVRITGTTTLPREDLSDRLIAAGFEWMYEMVDGQLVLKHSGTVARGMAKALWETGGEAARVGVDLIEQGTKLLQEPIPNPIGPVRNGVGSILNGILGNPVLPAEERDRDAPTIDELFDELENEGEPRKDVPADPDGE